MFSNVVLFYEKTFGAKIYRSRQSDTQFGIVLRLLEGMEENQQKYC